MLAALLASQTAAELLHLSVCLPGGRGRTQQTSVTCRHHREAPGHRARPPGAPGSTYRQLGGGGDLRRCWAHAVVAWTPARTPTGTPTGTPAGTPSESDESAASRKKR